MLSFRPKPAGFEARLTNTSFAYNLKTLRLAGKRIPAPVELRAFGGPLVQPASIREKETKRPADSLQKQGPGPGGHVFRKGRSGNPSRFTSRTLRP